MDLLIHEDEELRGWKLPVGTINPIRIQRERIDRNWVVPEPANFKITLENTSNNIRRVDHGYKIDNVELENGLVLTLTSP